MDDFQQQALEGSVFSDYGTMLAVRALGAGVMAIIIAFIVVYGIYAPFWRYMNRKFPAVGENLYLKHHRQLKQKDRDYAEYLKWAQRHGYEPIKKDAI